MLQTNLFHAIHTNGKYEYKSGLTCIRVKNAGLISGIFLFQLYRCFKHLHNNIQLKSWLFEFIFKHLRLFFVVEKRNKETGT